MHVGLSRHYLCFLASGLRCQAVGIGNVWHGVYDLGHAPSWMCGVFGNSTSWSFSFFNYKMGHLFPSHKVIVETVGADVPAPSCFSFSLPEVFLLLFAWIAPIHPSECLGSMSPPSGSPPWSLVPVTFPQCGILVSSPVALLWVCVSV